MSYMMVEEVVTRLIDMHDDLAYQADYDTESFDYFGFGQYASDLLEEAGYFD